MPEAIPEGDYEKGKRMFKLRCQHCHSLDETTPHRLGPHLHGIIGRTAGTVVGYRYTQANRDKVMGDNHQDVDNQSGQLNTEKTTIVVPLPSVPTEVQVPSATGTQPIPLVLGQNPYRWQRNPGAATEATNRSVAFSRRAHRGKRGKQRHPQYSGGAVFNVKQMEIIIEATKNTSAKSH